MSKSVIIVGTGEYYENLAQPSLDYFIKKGEINDVHTVDIKEKSGLKNHNIRKEGQNLSEIIDNIGQNEPIVILAHPNILHTPDAQELICNSGVNPNILMEKPYAISNEQLKTLLEQIQLSNVGLLEYYLSMKSVPLLIFGGLVNHDSFYFKQNGIIKSNQNLNEISGNIEGIIGTPINVICDILEGQGLYGILNHRNRSLVQKNLGGGMIQDLGIHALTPLIAMNDYLGKISKDSIQDIKVAHCNQYLDWAKNEFGLMDYQVGESYAELELTSSSNVPISIKIGKYVGDNKNQRRIIITGTRGLVNYDLTNNILSYQTGDDLTSINAIKADKKNFPKYLAVLKAGFETVKGNNPFQFNPNLVSYNAQKFVLEILETIPLKNIKKYEQGTIHDLIFK